MLMEISTLENIKMVYQHGQGTYTYANGDKYVGEYKDGNNTDKELILMLMEQ